MMTVVSASTTNATSEAGGSAVWRACFHGWPANVPQRGVLVTTFDEQIPFAGFMVADEMLFLERRSPDTMGTRSVIVPFANIVALKIVDPIEAREFRSFGFQSVAAPKKEARAAASTRLAAAAPGDAL
jgi:hypothetical protein